MKNKGLFVLEAAVYLLLTAVPMFAHHAGGIYDRDHNLTFTGTVTEYHFTNPHVQIVFDVRDKDGNVESWTAESAPPQRLYRNGWKRNSLNPGDEITVTGAPAKDGKHLLSIRKLVGADGKVLTEGAE